MFLFFYCEILNVLCLSNPYFQAVTVCFISSSSNFLIKNNPFICCSVTSLHTSCHWVELLHSLTWWRDTASETSLTHSHEEEVKRWETKHGCGSRSEAHESSQTTSEYLVSNFISYIFFIVSQSTFISVAWLLRSHRTIKTRFSAGAH